MTASPTADERVQRRARIMALLAQSAEWYDFFLYTTAAAIVFPQLFFSASGASGSVVATLTSFATVAVGFIARPIGGIIFGHLGDRRGRKPALLIALSLMGVATLAIALLPSYATWGIAAPVTLTALRVVQGLALGGQWGGGVLVATEYAPPKKRGLYGAYAQLGMPLGLIAATTVFLVAVAMFGPEQFLAYGWRIPFIVGGLAIAVPIVEQLKLPDTPAFRATRTDPKRRSPAIVALRDHPRAILAAAGAFLSSGAAFYVLTTGMLSYGTQYAGYTREQMLICVLVGAFGMVASVLAGAHLSDVYGRKRVFGIGIALPVLTIVPAFALIGTGDVVLAAIGIGVAMTSTGIAYGPTAALFTECFPAEVRYSGVSVSYQLSNVVGGGFAPMITTALLAAGAGVTGIVAYVLAVAVVSAVALIFVRHDIDVTPAAADPHPAAVRAEGRS